MSKSYGGLAREQGATRRVRYSAANDNQPSGGVRRPMNDNVPPEIYRAAREAAVAYYADRLGRVASHAALPLRYLDLAQGIDDWMAAAAMPQFVPNRWMVANLKQVCVSGGTITHWAQVNGIPAALCGVGGQALGNGYPLSDILAGNQPAWTASGNFAIFLTQRFEVAPGQYRHTIRHQWQHTGTSPNPGGDARLRPRPYAFAPSPTAMVNPNLMRALPSAEPVVSVVPDAAPTTSVPSAQIWSSSAPRVRLGVSPRRPADHGTKERKALSKGQALAIALFRALDQTSEAAEIVDAFFEALPKDVQKRWSRNRPNRQFIDAAGQYGIDGADWKMQALYYNWDKVDLDQAVKNVIWNHYEDKLYGAIHRNLPRNTINALAPGEKAIAKALSELRDWLEW